jgi:hypothetical protein
MCTSSYKIPWKNIFYTSNCLRHQLVETVMDNIIRIVTILTTGLKVSSQSMAYLCLKPFVTNLALYLLMVPPTFV